MSSGLHTVHEYTLKPDNTQTRSKTKYLSWPQHINILFGVLLLLPLFSYFLRWGFSVQPWLTQTHSLGQADLELTEIHLPLTLSAGIKAVSHHTLQHILFYLRQNFIAQAGLILAEDDDLALMILLPQPPKCWVTATCYHNFMIILGLEFHP